MPGSVYSSLVKRVYASASEVFPFHVGDTWMEPAAGCRMEDLSVAEHPGMHRYAPVAGLPGLVDRIVERQRARTGLAVERSEVLVTAGATGGLGAVVGGLVAPGDEVLICAPYWPLIAGIVRSFSGVAVPVPLIGAVDSAQGAAQAIRAACTERTVALYVNTPNNPTGRIIPADWMAAMVDVATSEQLWIFADEVYEDYVYAAEHRYVRPLAPERTLAAHSFSKAYGMAGNRAGYVVGPAQAMPHVRKVGVHTVYSTPTASQLTAERVMGAAGDDWIAVARKAYAEVGRAAAELLGVEPPEGSTFLWMDVAHLLDERGLNGFLEDAGEQGLLLAPGPSFGPYPTHVRLCFTAVPPEVTLRGVARLAAML
ncbi:MAG: pyridoxal phosphate-dependent aminotransferase [Myxococcales bacterium]|nr:pyridoxal phosphate-dependent aminotransferase [Myxococcales bacterium]